MTSPDSPSPRPAWMDAHIDELLRLSAVPDNRALWRIRVDDATSLALLDRLREAEAAQEAPAPDGLRAALKRDREEVRDAFETIAMVDHPLAAREYVGTLDAAFAATPWPFLAPPSPAEPPRPDVDALTAAYRERAMVVAALFRVGGYHPVVVLAPDAPGWWIVYAETPEGQVSWHIAEADLPIFEGTGWTALGTYEWDGHTTDEKYERLSRLRAEARPPEGLDPDRLAEALAVIDPWAADPAFREGARAIVAEYARLLEKT